MSHIIHLIRRSSLVRIFLVVVFSLGTAWIVGAGWRSQAAPATDSAQPPAATSRLTGSSSGTSVKNDSTTSTQSQSSVTYVSTNTLDKAVRMLGGVDRERNALINSPTLAKSSNVKAAGSDTNAANATTNTAADQSQNKAAVDAKGQAVTLNQTGAGK